jgi:hypothetical protein
VVVVVVVTIRTASGAVCLAYALTGRQNGTELLRPVKGQPMKTKACVAGIVNLMLAGLAFADTAVLGQARVDCNTGPTFSIVINLLPWIILLCLIVLAVLAIKWVISIQRSLQRIADSLPRIHQSLQDLADQRKNQS